MLSAWLFLRDDIFHGDLFMLRWVGLNCITLFEYAFLSTLFFLLDKYKRPAFLLKYKIQTNVNMDVVKFTHAVRRVAINFLLIQVPFTYVTTHLMIKRGCSN